MKYDRTSGIVKTGGIDQGTTDCIEQTGRIIGSGMGDGISRDTTGFGRKGSTDC